MAKLISQRNQVPVIIVSLSHYSTQSVGGLNQTFSYVISICGFVTLLIGNADFIAE